MVKIVWMYYEEGLTQARIAHTLKLSRPMVSRLLTEARQRKVVEFKIRYPWQNDRLLQDELVRTYHLRDARVLVVDDLNQAGALNGVGIMAAQLVETYLQDGMTLAVSRGTGVVATAQALAPHLQIHIRMVQLQGAMGDRILPDSDVAHILMSRFAGEFYALNAPLLLESPFAAEALSGEPSIRAAMDIAKNADIALVGVGSIHPEVSSLLRHGLVSCEELEGLASQGIVGDIAGRFFDENGQAVNIDFNRRLISLGLEAVRKIPIVIGVASGAQKVDAIRAALRAQNINMLATDSMVAQKLLSR